MNVQDLPDGFRTGKKLNGTPCRSVSPFWSREARWATRSGPSGVECATLNSTRPGPSCTPASGPFATTRARVDALAARHVVCGRSDLVHGGPMQVPFYGHVR